MGNKVDMVDEREGDGLDTHGQRVNPLVNLELLLDGVMDFVLGIEAEVLGPHAGHHLANGTEGILHCARADSFPAGSDISSAPALGKELEEVEHGIDSQLFTIVAPQEPGVVFGLGACWNCAGSERLHCNAMISADRRQGLLCG